MSDEFAHCSCSSHIAQDGTITWRQSVIERPHTRPTTAHEPSLDLVSALERLKAISASACSNWTADAAQRNVSKLALVVADLAQAIAARPASPQVEHYARCTVAGAGLTVEPGVEMRDEDDFAALQVDLREFAAWIIDLRVLFGGEDRMAMLHTLEDAAVERWPGRAWFVEIFDCDGSWSQSYMPFGMPRTQ